MILAPLSDSIHRVGICYPNQHRQQSHHWTPFHQRKMFEQSLTPDIQNTLRVDLWSALNDPSKVDFK